MEQKEMMIEEDMEEKLDRIEKGEDRRVMDRSEKSNRASRLGMAEDMNSEEKEESRKACRVENGENEG